MQTNKSIRVSIVNSINVACMQLQREHLVKDKTQEKDLKETKKRKKTNQQNKNRNRG